MSTVATAVAKSPPEEEVDPTEQIERKITYLLQEYPIISQSMLQYGLGPTLKAGVWRPVLDKMITDGKIQSWIDDRVSPAGRHHGMRKLALTGLKDEVEAILDKYHAALPE